VGFVVAIVDSIHSGGLDVESACREGSGVDAGQHPAQFLEFCEVYVESGDHGRRNCKCPIA